MDKTSYIIRGLQQLVDLNPDLGSNRVHWQDLTRVLTKLSEDYDRLHPQASSGVSVIYGPSVRCNCKRNLGICDKLCEY